jgi:hypothetical protein
MPLYAYAVIREDGGDGEVFEIFQRMSAPSLTHHPVSGAPVRRLLTCPRVGRADPGQEGEPGGDGIDWAYQLPPGSTTMQKLDGVGPESVPLPPPGPLRRSDFGLE